MKLSISKNYGEKKIFENLSLEIEEGKILCIFGGSGGGKTTLLNILAGLTDYDGRIDGEPKGVSYIFQEPRLLPHLSPRENLRYAMQEPNEQKIAELLQKTELTDCADRKARLLSGGEKQRVAIARAFLSESSLLLMDEPFSSLDTPLKIRLISSFANLWKENKKTTVFVTHDVEEVLMLADRVVVLDRGKITADYELTRTEFPSLYGQENPIRQKLLSAF